MHFMLSVIMLNVVMLGVVAPAEVLAEHTFVCPSRQLLPKSNMLAGLEHLKVASFSQHLASLANLSVCFGSLSLIFYLPVKQGK